MRQELQDFKNTVEGRTVFILGGGSSVTSKDLELLHTKKVFALNSSCKFITNPCGVLWCDDSWISSNLEFLNTKKYSKFFVKPLAARYISENIKTIGGATVLNRGKDFGLDADINSVCGNNSGAYAINLLVNCKVKTIGLVGFDMYVDRGYNAHFHKDYTYTIRPEVYKDTFIPSITSMANVLANNKCGIKIYNCNPLSELKCFEFKNIKDIT